MRITKWLIVAMTGLFIASCSDSKDEPNVPVGPTEPTTVAVTGVSVNKSSVTIVEGNSETVTATVSPDNASDKTLTWKSFDPSVATVDSSGKITAIKPGITTISVSSADGVKTATVDVIVTVSQLNAQRAVLENFYNLMEGSKWENNNNWNSSKPLSEWFGVTVEGDQVVGLELPNNNLTGNLPELLADLPYLKTLNLSDNKISGSIPASWGEAAETRAMDDEATTRPDVTMVKFISLTILNLSGNSLTGAIPATLFNITTLQVLNLSGNALTGEIPEEIGNLTGLTSLDLSNNNLSGPLPETIVNLANLKVLSISNNILSGEISVNIQKSDMWSNLTEEPDLTQQNGYELVKEIEITVPVSGVSLSSTTLELTTGDTATLTATVAPNDASLKTVIWSSSNTSVATVVDGIVTAVAPGTATITVTTINESKTATCEVTVKVPVVEVTGVTLNNTTMTLKVGETGTLEATVAPDNATTKEVTWSTSNAAVATVNNGSITAVAEGTATITVTTKDGNLKATCIVTVEAAAQPENPSEGESESDSGEDSSDSGEDGSSSGDSDPTPSTVAVTGVTLNKELIELAPGAEFTLTASVAPSNATNKKVTWTSYNDAVATVVNGVVKAIAAGEANVTVTTEDGNFHATCKVVVTANFDGNTENFTGKDKDWIDGDLDE